MSGMYTLYCKPHWLYNERSPPRIGCAVFPYSLYLSTGVLKVAGDKIVSLLATEFATITGVKRDLSELQDIHTEITRWLSAARDRAIQSDPQSPWVVILKHVAYDIDNVLQEVQLEAEK